MGCGHSTNSSDSQGHKWINAVYYPNWKIYSGKSPAGLDLQHISHVFYAFALLRRDGTVHLGDEWADTQMLVDGERDGCLGSFSRLKASHSHLKLILSIGGGAGSENFASVASDSTAVRRFVKSAKYLVMAHNLDGIDIDWEHPSSIGEGNDYVNLLKATRNEFPPQELLLTTALPAGIWALQNIRLSRLVDYVEYINLMTYDFSGPWTSCSGYNSQLFSPNVPHSSDQWLSCHSAMQYLEQRSVPFEKILLGVPVYGRAFPGTTGPGQVPIPGVEHREYEFFELPLRGTEENIDRNVWAASCVHPDPSIGFVSYESPETVNRKARYVRDTNLGGLFYWHGAGDGEASRSLVLAGYDVLNEMSLPDSGQD